MYAGEDDERSDAACVVQTNCIISILILSLSLIASVNFTTALFLTSLQKVVTIIPNMFSHKEVNYAKQ